jgi:enolase
LCESRPAAAVGLLLPLTAFFNPLTVWVQDIPLYEFLRKEDGRDRGAYVMPVPFLNVLNGIVHSGNTMAFQEIMIAPVGATSIEEAMRMASEVYHCPKKVISEKYGASGKSSSLVNKPFEG